MLDMIGNVSTVLNQFKALVVSKEIETRKALIDWSEALFSTAGYVAESSGCAGLTTRFSNLTSLLSNGKKAFELPATVKKIDSFKVSFRKCSNEFGNGFTNTLNKVRLLTIDTFKVISTFTGACQLLIKEKVVTFGSSVDTLICKPGVYFRSMTENQENEKFWNTFESISGIGKIFTAAYLSLGLVDNLAYTYENPQRGVLKTATTLSFISLCLFAKVMRPGVAPALALAASTSVLYQMSTTD